LGKNLKDKVASYYLENPAGQKDANTAPRRKDTRTTNDGLVTMALIKKPALTIQDRLYRLLAAKSVSVRWTLTVCLDWLNRFCYRMCCQVFETRNKNIFVKEMQACQIEVSGYRQFLCINCLDGYAEQSGDFFDRKITGSSHVDSCTLRPCYFLLVPKYLNHLQTDLFVFSTTKISSFKLKNQYQKGGSRGSIPAES
jgi:hypothetical protein